MEKLEKVWVLYEVDGEEDDITLFDVTIDDEGNIRGTYTEEDYWHETVEIPANDVLTYIAD